MWALGSLCFEYVIFAWFGLQSVEAKAVRLEGGRRKSDGDFWAIGATLIPSSNVGPTD